MKYKKNDVGAPDGLKNAMLGEKNNVPISGVFHYKDEDKDHAVVFYADRIK